MTPTGIEGAPPSDAPRAADAIGARPAPLPVLLIDHARALGGAERSLLLLMEHVDRSRWACHLACREGALADRAAALGFPVHTLEMPRLRRSSRVVRDLAGVTGAIAQAARQVGAGVVHTNTVRATLYGVIGARRARRPAVWHMRDFGLSEGWPRRPTADRWAKRVIARSCARVVVNSRAVAELMPGTADPVVVHNAVDAGAFAEAADPAAFRQAYGLSAGDLLVGTVGRLRPWKGQDRFLRAMARVSAEHPDARFVVVGGALFDVDDDYARRLPAVAGDLGLGDRVRFTGQLADVRPALAAFDVFVHPGDPEPFGLVNVEAMAAGLPVVAFDHGALPEIVVDGDTGLLVPPADEVALAAAVGRLLRDRSLRGAMGARGRARALSRFSPERMAAEVMAVWAGVVGRHRTAGAPDQGT